MAAEDPRVKKLLSVSGNVLRAFLLVTALSAVGLPWLWNRNPALIDRLDTYLLQAYEESYTSGVDAALEPLRAGRTSEASEALKELISDMGEVRKQDRRAPAYARALEIQLEISRREGNRKRALELSGRLVDLNPNHYGYWLEHSRELSDIGRGEESIEALYRAYRIAPAEAGVARPLLGLLSGRGREAEAAGVARGYLEANRPGYVRVFWAVEDEYFSGRRASSHRLVRINGRRQSVRIPVNEGHVSRVRINFPQVPSSDIVIASFSAVTPAGGIEIDLGEVRLEYLDMLRKGPGGFTVTGDEPYFVLWLPEDLRGVEILSLRMDAAFEPEAYGEIRGYLKRGMDGKKDR
jgi:tetratricopeptide (TPR) repeat protein